MDGITSPILDGNIIIISLITTLLMPITITIHPRQRIFMRRQILTLITCYHMVILDTLTIFIGVMVTFMVTGMVMVITSVAGTLMMRQTVGNGRTTSKKCTAVFQNVILTVSMSLVPQCLIAGNRLVHGICLRLDAVPTSRRSKLVTLIHATTFRMVKFFDVKDGIK